MWAYFLLFFKCELGRYTLQHTIASERSDSTRRVLYFMYFHTPHLAMQQEFSLCWPWPYPWSSVRFLVCIQWTIYIKYFNFRNAFSVCLSLLRGLVNAQLVTNKPCNRPPGLQVVRIVEWLVSCQYAYDVEPRPPWTKMMLSKLRKSLPSSSKFMPLF